LVWAFGFGVEATADAQKSRFRANPENRGKSIQTGLWARSRHPNYLGEIVLWVGVAIISLPILRGWEWIALISPLFVTVLLTRISGVPILEKRADEKWGGQEDYEAYKERTPVLIPRLFAMTAKKGKREQRLDGTVPRTALLRRNQPRGTVPCLAA
jgi:steroid 5-alpha reductase family enzyme